MALELGVATDQPARQRAGAAPCRGLTAGDAWRRDSRCGVARRESGALACRARRDTIAARCHPSFLQHSQSRFDSAARPGRCAEVQQQANQRRPRVLIITARFAPACVRERGALRIVSRRRISGPQQTRLGADCRLAFALHHASNIVEVRQVETFERHPAVTRGRFLQLLEGAAFDFPVGQGGERDDVDLDPCRVEADADPVSDDALLRARRPRGAAASKGSSATSDAGRRESPTGARTAARDGRSRRFSAR